MTVLAVADPEVLDRLKVARRADGELTGVWDVVFTYAGVNRRVPIFHRPHDRRSVSDLETGDVYGGFEEALAAGVPRERFRTAYLTGCGIEHDVYANNQHTVDLRGLPLKLAAAIARPCLICWPDERGRW